MKNRMSRCAALIGTVLSLSSFAQVCNEVTLYKSGETGYMESGNTFPEMPEWSANWGEKGSLVPPYVRWSGMKNVAGNWAGTMVMNGLPSFVQGGSLKLDVHSTKNAKVGVWLEGDFGKSSVYYQNISADASTSLEIPLENLAIGNRALVQKVGVGLFDVPANQYTTFFMDNVRLTCGVAESSGEDDETADVAFPFSDVNPSDPVREGRFSEYKMPVTTAAYSAEERQKISDSTRYSFVLDEAEHDQIEGFVEATDLSAKQSREGWYNAMYLIDHNRLQDGLIANPKALFYEAEVVAAASDNMVLPILVGNVDYGYRICADSTCEQTVVEGARALVAGLPSSSVGASTFKLVYDPFFVTTNRGAPVLEVLSEKQWHRLEPKSELTVRFESAGLQKLVVRLEEGGVKVEQTLFVEVK